ERPRENFSDGVNDLPVSGSELLAPRNMPPAVGWDFTWALRSLVLSRTSTTDHNQGGRYSPRRNSRSTIVRLWTFTGLSETVSLYGSASCADRTASSIASRSVRKGGLISRYVLTVAPAACATCEAWACSLRPHILLTANRRTRSFLDSRPRAGSRASTRCIACSTRSARHRWGGVSTVPLSHRSPSPLRIASRTSG